MLKGILNNSLIFGDVEFGKYGIIEYVKRPAIAPIEIIEKEISGRDGSLYKSSRLEPLLIVAEIRIFDKYKDGIDSIINEIMGLLYSKELKPLNYKNKKVWYDAVLSDVGTPEKYRNKIAYVSLTFKVPSGDGRSKDRITYYKQFTDKSITTSSSRETKGIFKFSGDEVKITNMRTGEFIYIKNGSDADFIIDCEKEMVTSKGINMMDCLSWNSDFFDIKSGDRIKSTKPVDLEFYARYLYDY